MNVQTYLAQLAQQLGCVYVPKCTAFKDDYIANVKGAVVGARKGYLVTLALTRQGRNSGFAIMVRFPASTAATQLQESIKSKPGFSSFLSRKNIKVLDNRLTVSWVYVMKKPKLEDITAMLDALLEECSRYVPAFNGKCEDCGVAETREITLMNGVAGYHCLACQTRVIAEKRREAEEYKAKDANYVLGILAGLIVAAVAGTMWGELLNWIEVGEGKWYPQMHALGGFAVGIPVCLVLFKAAGKRDRVGQVAAILLTLAGKWWGDVLYYSHAIAYSTATTVTAPLITQTVQHFFSYKFYDGLHMLVTGADLVCSAAIPWTPWGRLPKFEPVFQTINSDGSLTQAAAQSAGAP
jgi:hypothetical protein